MPPDHVIVLLEGLTTLCQYCLLDVSAQDVGMVGQLSPLTRTGFTSETGLLSNLANVFHFGSQRVISLPSTLCFRKNVTLFIFTITSSDVGRFS